MSAEYGATAEMEEEDEVRLIAPEESDLEDVESAMGRDPADRLTSMSTMSTEDSEGQLLRQFNIDLTREMHRIDEMKLLYPESQRQFNSTVEVEQMITGEEFVDLRRLTKDQKRAVRNSFLAPEVAADLTPEEAKALARQNRLNKIGLFALAVVINGCSSVLTQIAMRDPLTGAKNVTWIKRMPLMTAYASSVTFALVASPILYGVESLYDLLNPREIMLHAPISLAYVFQDVAVVEVQQRINASLWKVISQSKMGMTAVGAYLFLQRRQSLTQWLLLINISILICLYGSQGLSTFEISSYGFLVLGLASLLATTTAGLASEIFIKKARGHFITQFGTMRISGLVLGCIVMFYEITKDDQWHLFPYGNFSPRVFLIVLAELANSWVTTLVVKRLDSVWKSFVGSIGLGITYVLELTLPNSRGFNFTLFALIVSIAISVVTYAAAARDRMKVTQLAFDKEKKQ